MGSAQISDRLSDRRSCGSVALVGSGATAIRTLQSLRSAGATVRWYTDDLDVAEELLLASAPPGELEISVSDPLQADYSEFVAVVAASETALDQEVALRAGPKTILANLLDRKGFAASRFALDCNGQGAGRAPIQDRAA